MQSCEDVQREEEEKNRIEEFNSEKQMS